ncbi:hypothetical protein KUH32_14625 [Thalassococcus sp. CAU 1522]|uniref:Lipoprotein n=1 Tax=Thalassococcus arenae TaxID=2851652 RepID=A0ABS6NAE5_9RHOB|nr:hypothetical protein [Thalassococcus arenae]MBV2360997.1 hypothetical protein [Thalassococcus arenae]
MFRMTATLILAAFILTSCGSVRDSRLNPFNWFGRSQPEAVTDGTGTVNPLIPRRRASLFRDEQDDAYRGRPVAEITELLIERRPGGAILRVTGVAERVGPFDVRLIEDEQAGEAGTLSYTLNALQQAGPRDTGPNARTVTAALWLTDQDLAGIRAIRVAGASNARVTRR